VESSLWKLRVLIEGIELSGACSLHAFAVFCTGVLGIVEGVVNDNGLCVGCYFDDPEGQDLASKQFTHGAGALLGDLPTPFCN